MKERRGRRKKGGRKKACQSSPMLSKLIMNFLLLPFSPPPFLLLFQFFFLFFFSLLLFLPPSCPLALIFFLVRKENGLRIRSDVRTWGKGSFESAIPEFSLGLLIWCREITAHVCSCESLHIQWDEGYLPKYGDGGQVWAYYQGQVRTWGRERGSGRKRLSEVHRVQHWCSEKSSIGQVGQDKDVWCAFCSCAFSQISSLTFRPSPCHLDSRRIPSNCLL